jgi:hypothetical protein
MVEELEKRERAVVKKAKTTKEDEVRVRNETERIKEEGRRLREARQAKIDRTREEAVTDKVQVEVEDGLDMPPELSKFFTPRLLHERMLTTIYRSTRYHNPRQMVSQISPRTNHIRINSLPPLLIRLNRHRINRSLTQTTKKIYHCIKTTEKRYSVGTVQTNRRCI